VVVRDVDLRGGHGWAIVYVNYTEWSKSRERRSINVRTIENSRDTDTLTYRHNPLAKVKPAGDGSQVRNRRPWESNYLFAPCTCTVTLCETRGACRPGAIKI